MIDLTGNIFGELTVVEYKGKDEHGHGLWLCRCSCGKEKIITSGNLREGKTNSCGHIKKNASQKYVGAIFGNTQVLSIIDKKPQSNGAYVHCKCILCGNEFDTTIVTLRKGFRQSCGCDKFVDLTNKRYGNVIVIEFAGKDFHGHSQWKCRCNCGKEFFATTSNLNVGAIVSCGCRKRETAHNMIGNVYGYTKVIGILDSVTPEGGTIAIGQCLKCGKEFHIPTKTLKKGYSSSCGCYKKEVLEQARNERDSEDGKQKSGLYANTNLPRLLSKKVSSNNTSGVRGVEYRHGKYLAYIGFQGKYHYLGSYDTLEQATNARKAAEEEIITPVFEQYVKEVENKGNWIKKFLDSKKETD